MEIVTKVEALRKPTKPVKESADIREIYETVANLFRELKEHNALGLSANQLGYDLSIFVMRMDPLPPICVMNPTITKQRGHQFSEEGCLSLPGVVVSVKRPYQVTVRGLNQYFKPVKHKLSGIWARVVCHEIDHLHGKLIIDYKEKE